VDLGGSVRRISYFGSSQPPTAVLQANPTTGTAPLTVTFDGRGSSDPDPGDKLTYSWDLNGDGQFGDSTLACCPTHTYAVGTYTVQLRVTDESGASDTASVVVSSNNTPPTASINTPSASLAWKVGDAINFSGSATDQQDGALPPAALSWSLVLHHCPSNCHQHLLQSFTGVSSGSFTAPDHEYPSHLELRLTATDSGNLQTATSVLLYPQTVTLRLETTPMKLQLSLNGTTRKAPFTMTVIVGSRNTISAPSPQFVGNTQYDFVSWSDNGASTHTIVAGASAIMYTATYRKVDRR
jgi:PKD repeat protein